MLDYAVDDDGNAIISIRGDWHDNFGGAALPKDTHGLKSVTVDAADIGKWGTPLMILLYRLNAE